MQLRPHGHNMEARVVQPLLSICIPTYNRAELLRSALLSLVPQIAALGNLVELVISDNASPDYTADVIADIQKKIPLRCIRQEENIGGAANVIAVVDQAQGVYCWITGDDDLVRPGGIAHVVGVLQEHPSLDFVFVNIANINVEELAKFPKPVVSDVLPTDLPRSSLKMGEGPVRFEELIDHSISTAFLGAIQQSVFRRSSWIQHSKEIKIGKLFSSLAATYPHSVIFAKAFVGRPAWYIETPLVVVIDGAREWVDSTPMIIVVRLNELLDLYEQQGVPAQQIKRCREKLLSSAGPLIFHLLFHRNVPGRQYFSFPRFMIRYGRSRALRSSLRSTFKKNLSESIASGLKGVGSLLQR